ncbi:ATP-dependent Lon protease pim1 [Clathrus columnatus]|uniref:Lon protease homolog, mitochondrial n=1 Tax=Clathrus columnatus TaxID=1419009 RepID=A0AAV5A6K2_9AGAM|nr:ATP-dependent Lon protease pim1 [Clathrus columnatus]
MANAFVSRSTLSKTLRFRCHSYPCLSESSSSSTWRSAYRFLYQDSCRRNFATNLTQRYPRRTDIVGSPRWINRQNGKSNKESGDEEDGEGNLEETSERHNKPQSESSETKVRLSEDGGERASSSSAAPPSSSGGHGGDSGEGPSSSSSAPPPHRETTSPTSAISKQNVPENYPQVLALPIARRPLFPGFYKAVVIRNPAVVAAVKEMMKRGQPYLGAFLLKDEHTDSDIISDINSVHHVGVFAQITSIFSASGGAPKEEDGKEEGLTAVLYPHRRIKLTSLVTRADSTTTANIQDLSEGSKEAPFTPPPSPPTSGVEEVPSAEGTVSHAAVRTPPLQTSFLHNYPISIVNVDNLTAVPFNKDDQYIRAVMSEIVSVFKDIAQLNPLFRDQITNFSISQIATNVFDEPDKLADFAAAVSAGDVNELQDVLESLVIEDRLRKALLVLKKELINAQLQSKISRDVDSKIAKRQREYYLMEQLKGIKKELGMESDGKDKLIEKFKERAANLKMPESVHKVFEEELNKLMHLEPAASEANVTRNYLDWLTQIPWGQHSPENYSITHAKKVLDEDHYGLKDVKDRILEFLAVGKLRGTVEGKIICFVGPPGVGKTSIGKSIARALNRQFFRFSVGGLTDVAEIKGHRRTYVGLFQLPNDIRALRVDKIGRGINGDPASALLEMLDPEQNNAFLDHYMDVPVDLSRVLFVCTANVADTIPAPLLDRMEVLEVSGYVSEEKSVIADKYLGPQAKEAAGLKNADVQLEQDAVDTLIKYYCRESGVRNLKKHIDKIYRKAALKIVEDLGEEAFPEEKALNGDTKDTKTRTVENMEPAQAISSSSEEPKKEERTNVTTEERKPLDIPSTVHVRINSGNLKEYVGPPVYHKDRMYVTPPPPGVSTGLGYLGNGSGAVMPVEATSMPGKGSLQLTGKLGEVIRESAQIALSWVKSHAWELGISQDPAEQWLNERDVHVHMPEGSIGKEGPSAGTAIVSAFVSLLTKTKIDPDIAMTGEISLVGQVLPVGGLKEKILAAHRAGIKTILAPAANRADIEENVPESVKTGIRFVYVEDVREVLHEVFRDEPLAELLKERLPLDR